MQITVNRGTIGGELNVSSESTQQLTSLLSNDLLGRLERLRLNPQQRRTNRSRGEHLAGKGGNSTEFSDYRDYVAGDDIRSVDWNIFARLHRPYVKLYQHEEELHVVVLVDASSSMESEEKFLRATECAAALSVMALLNGERLSVYAYGGGETGPSVLPPCRGRTSFLRVFRFLEGLECGGSAGIEQTVDRILRLHSGRGLIFLLSDFLTFGDLTRSFNLLYSAGLEIGAIQFLGPSELNPEIDGDVRFRDVETGRTLDVSAAGDLLRIYHDHRLALEEELQGHCRKRNGRFVLADSSRSVDDIMFDELLRQGWVG